MEIRWVHPERFREQERGDAEARLLALAEGKSDLLSVRITARATEHHRHGAQEVSIACDARGREIVASRTRPDASLALNEALDAFEREVRRLRDRRAERRKPDAAHPPERGVIDRVVAAEGFGFILTDGGERVYFHRNAVQGGLEFERLEDGERVSLNYEAGDKGLQATMVRPER